MEAVTYPAILHQFSSQPEQNHRSNSQWKDVPYARRELERKFEIVLLAENARMEQTVVQRKAKTYPHLLKRVSSTPTRI
jgi:hypothetical protein